MSVEIRLSKEDRCDFCSSLSPARSYPCRSFGLDPGMRSTGDFLACADCALAIERNAWNDLAGRMALSETAQMLIRTGHKATLEQMAKFMVRQFRDNRTGPSTEYKRKDEC